MTYVRWHGRPVAAAAIWGVSLLASAIAATPAWASDDCQTLADNPLSVSGSGGFGFGGDFDLGERITATAVDTFQYFLVNGIDFPGAAGRKSVTYTMPQSGHLTVGVRWNGGGAFTCTPAAAAPPGPNLADQLTSLQLQLTPLIARTSGDAISSATSAGIDAAFAGTSSVSASPDGIALNYAPGAATAPGLAAVAAATNEPPASIRDGTPGQISTAPAGSAAAQPMASMAGRPISPPASATS